jgi:hypothetical protein
VSIDDPPKDFHLTGSTLSLRERNGTEGRKGVPSVLEDSPHLASAQLAQLMFVDRGVHRALQPPAHAPFARAWLIMAE